MLMWETTRDVRATLIHSSSACLHGKTMEKWFITTPNGPLGCECYSTFIFQKSKSNLVFCLSVNMLLSLIDSNSFSTWSVMRCVCKSLSCTWPRGRGVLLVEISRPSVSVPPGRPATNGRLRESWLRKTASRCLT